MDLLPLEDPRWRELDHRNWRCGKRSEWSPDAPFVPDELSELAKNPADIERFRRLWPWLCSEGTTYAAAYAAVPYMVAFAERLPQEQRFEYLCVVGLVEADSCAAEGESFAIKGYLADSYRRALSRALALIAETLGVRHDVTETRYLLGAAAALKGHRKLAKVLQDMDAISGQCPECGETVFPEELQVAKHAMDAFPPAPVNDEAGRVSCPAFGRVIDDGLCWECCMADHGGPTDTAEELRRWVAASERFGSVADFQRVCAGCPHCAWRPAE